MAQTMTRVEIIEGVSKRYDSGWELCFQSCKYHHQNGESESGLRFIWKDPNGNLKPQRGQARIPDSTDLLYLIFLASQKGWF